jgi:RNA polymerase primary sigma factor
VGQDEDTEWIDCIKNEDTIASNDDLDYGLLRDRLNSLLGELDDRERDIIKLRFGLADGQEHSFNELGQMYEMSRERVRQIQAKAMQKLRHPRCQALLKDWI